MSSISKADKNRIHSAGTLQSVTFGRVSKTNPCPLCGKPDWCKTSPDNAVVMCPRTDTAPTGWKRIKDTVDGQGIYKLETEGNFETQVSGRRPTKRTSKPKPAPVPPVPIGLKLAKIENAITPERQPISDKFWSIVKKKVLEETPKTNPEAVWQIAYSYGGGKTVHRAEWDDETSPKGYKKTHRPSCIDNGLFTWGKGKEVWNVYRIDEVLGILDNAPINEPVAPLMVEGESNVEIARSRSIASITLQGSDWSEEQIETVVKELQRVNCRALPYLYDNDDPGRKKANQIKTVCSRLQFPCILIDPATIFPGIPEKGDIKEILDAMDAQEFIRRLEAQMYAAALNGDGEKGVLDTVEVDIPDVPPAAEKHFTQKAADALYSETPHVSIAGILHRWTGTHYEPCELGVEKRRIAGWLNAYAEYIKGRWLHNRATPDCVEQALKWVIQQKAISPNEVNSGGLNCTNGVVEINSDGSHVFVSHSPERVYTYAGCEYNAEADATGIEQLLQCLAPADREILLRTAAAALCLPLARMKIGRKIKAVLCYGDGSNGKDTLRTVLAAILGRGMTGKTLSDFKAYDGGRKFPLAGLETSIVNWASENTDAVKLDGLQSLKQAVTGDELDAERKGKDSVPFKPNCVLLFNCNKLPSVTGGMEAIASRYSIIKFSKTFKTNPNLSRGELKADPRFKDDPQFVSNVLAPALLNKLLERIPLLLTEGIDHSGAAEAMREAQEESRHLWAFVRDISLEERLQQERVPVADLWADLREWYLENGWLEIEYTRKPGSSEIKEKEVWQEPPNGGDKPATNRNQLFARLKDLFPKLKAGRTNTARYLTLMQVSETSEKQPSLLSPNETSSPETLTKKGVEVGDSLGDSTGKNSDSNSNSASQLSFDFVGDSSDSSDADLTEPSLDLSELSPEPSPTSSDALASDSAVEQNASDSSDSNFSLVGENVQSEADETSPQLSAKQIPLTVGAKVRYIGDIAKRGNQYANREMTVVSVDWCKYGFWEFTCSYPDTRAPGGISYTTRLMADELE